MAVKLSVGLQKKIGQPNYGSLGASCHVEFEIDHSMIDGNPDGFHQTVSRAFAACKQAVNDQLAQQQVNPPDRNGSSRTSRHPRESFDSNAKSNGSGTDRKPPGSSMTTNQLRAILAMARRQQLDLQSLIQQRFQRMSPADLSLREASTLIRELNRTAAEPLAAR